MLTLLVDSRESFLSTFCLPPTESAGGVQFQYVRHYGVAKPVYNPVKGGS
jgi:hypothetical protein